METVLGSVILTYRGKQKDDWPHLIDARRLYSLVVIIFLLFFGPG